MENFTQNTFGQQLTNDDHKINKHKINDCPNGKEYNPHARHRCFIIKSTVLFKTIKWIIAAGSKKAWSALKTYKKINKYVISIGLLNELHFIYTRNGNNVQCVILMQSFSSLIIKRMRWWIGFLDGDKHEHVFGGWADFLECIDGKKSWCLKSHINHPLCMHCTWINFNLMHWCLSFGT